MTHDADAGAERPDLPGAPQSPAVLSHRWIAVGAMAAGLALGIAVAGSFGIGGDLRSSGGNLFAQGALGEALNNELSGAGPVGPSFWSKDGTFCRAFTIRPSATGGLAGIACREGAAWRVRVVSQVDNDRSGDTAQSMPSQVRSAMDNLIVGATLDRSAEQQAQKQGWRTR